MRSPLKTALAQLDDSWFRRVVAGSDEFAAGSSGLPGRLALLVFPGLTLQSLSLLKMP